MFKRYLVTPPPHIHTDENPRSIMLDVVIALTPALAVALYFYGWRSVVLTVVSILSCVIFEYLYQKLTKSPVTVRDLSAVVTGMLLAYCLPVTTPYWMVIIAAAFAIIVVKQLFGGIGKNFMNPAMAALVFLLLSWPHAATTYPQPFADVPLWNEAVSDAGLDTGFKTGNAAPLELLRTIAHGGIDSAVEASASLPDTFRMTVGMHPGGLGETSSLVLALGGLFLLVRRVIRLTIPISFIAAVAVFSLPFTPLTMDAGSWALYNILAGNLVLAAFFMATDYSTSPITMRGQLLFGIGCGLVTVFLRQFGQFPEGVYFALLLMNCCAWALDKLGRPYILRRAKPAEPEDDE